ncbi:ATP synthase delta/epsilon chain alpha-helix domain-containing protein, partial [Oscillospiraceae bacterium WX1]
EARLRAEERLRQQQSMQEYRQSKLALARAMARLQVTKGRDKV